MERGEGEISKPKQMQLPMRGCFHYSAEPFAPHGTSSTGWGSGDGSSDIVRLGGCCLAARGIPPLSLLRNPFVNFTARLIDSEILHGRRLSCGVRLFLACACERLWFTSCWTIKHHRGGSRDIALFLLPERIPSFRCHFHISSAGRQARSWPAKDEQTINCPPASGTTRRRFHPRHLLAVCLRSTSACFQIARSCKGCTSGFFILPILPRMLDEYPRPVLMLNGVDFMQRQICQLCESVPFNPSRPRRR
jgi:hypothetical protein